MPKAIYLDIDGVLNSDEFADYMLSEDNVDIFNEDMLDPRAIVNLRKIVENTNAVIVLSSSWRWEKESRDAVHRQLKAKGIDFVDTTTLQTDITLSRGKEIEKHIEEHPNIENFVILDDDEITNPVLAPHHIRTTFKHGLTREKALAAIKILKIPIKNKVEDKT